MSSKHLKIINKDVVANTNRIVRSDWHIERGARIRNVKENKGQIIFR